MMRLVIRIQELFRDERGQDLIEYAMMAGFVALGAAAVMPGISTSISTVFSKVGSVMTVAGG
jgi:pilus assembly protein Flp/PilA